MSAAALTTFETRGSEGRSQAAVCETQAHAGQQAPYIAQARRVWYYGDGVFEQWTDRDVMAAKPMAGWDELKSVNQAKPVIEIEVRVGLRFEAIVRIDHVDEAGAVEQYFYLAAFHMNPDWSPGYVAPTYEWGAWQGHDEPEVPLVSLADAAWGCELCGADLPVDPDYAYEAGARTVFGTMCRKCGHDNTETW